MLGGGGFLRDDGRELVAVEDATATAVEAGVVLPVGGTGAALTGVEEEEDDDLPRRMLVWGELPRGLEGGTEEEALESVTPEEEDAAASSSASSRSIVSSLEAAEEGEGAEGLEKVGVGIARDATEASQPAYVVAAAVGRAGGEVTTRAEDVSMIGDSVVGVGVGVLSLEVEIIGTGGGEAEAGGAGEDHTHEIGLR